MILVFGNDEEALLAVGDAGEGEQAFVEEEVSGHTWKGHMVAWGGRGNESLKRKPGRTINARGSVCCKSQKCMRSTVKTYPRRI